MKEEKKFFAPILFHGNYDLSKEWFVYYYIPVNNGFGSKRIKISDGINRLKTVGERIEFSQIIIEKVKTGYYESNQRLLKRKLSRSVLYEAIEIKKDTRSIKTISANELHLKEWIQFLKRENKNEFNVKNIDVENFRNYLLNSGLSAKTVKNYLQSIKSLYNKYIDIYEIYNFRNPFQKITNISTSSKSKMWFNDFMIERIKSYLLKNKLDKLWLSCQLQYYCFIRPNELRQLKAEHFNLNAGYIEISADISKNRKRQKVSIPNPLYNSLEFIQYLEPSDYIFPSNTEGKCIGRNSLSKKHLKVIRALKIKGNYSFYSWKHTGVVKAVKNGIHIKDLQLQLRHSSLDMVNEYLKDLGVIDLDRIKDIFPEI